MIKHASLEHRTAEFQIECYMHAPRKETSCKFVRNKQRTMEFRGHPKWNQTKVNSIYSNLTFNMFSCFYRWRTVPVPSGTQIVQLPCVLYTPALLPPLCGLPLLKSLEFPTYILLFKSFFHPVISPSCCSFPEKKTWKNIGRRMPKGVVCIPNPYVDLSDTFTAAL